MAVILVLFSMPLSAAGIIPVTFMPGPGSFPNLKDDISDAFSDLPSGFRYKTMFLSQIVFKI